MGSTAWNENGSVPVKYNIPWGAVRKAALHYLGDILTVAKITLGGIVFDIGKQATQGLVVVGNGYSSVTFFLPDDKAPMTSDDGAAMSIYDYLTMLGQTNYGVIGAWDYFAQFVGKTANSLLEESGTDIPIISYEMYKNTSIGNAVTLYGTADFSTVTTAKEFFNILASNLDENSQMLAKGSRLSEWMEDDGAVAISFTISLGTDNAAIFPLYVGRK